MVLDGKQLADKICLELKERVSALKERGVAPKLTIITSGDNAAGKVYVRNKMRRAEEIGIDAEVVHYDELTSTDIVCEMMRATRPFIFQMPTTPEDALSDEEIQPFVLADEDADGFLHPDNIVALATGEQPANYPCTPKGIMRLLDAYGIEVNGQHVCIIGRSNIVGRPLSRMMEQVGATVTLCHSKTPEPLLYSCVDMADIVVAATGVRNILSLSRMTTERRANLANKVFIDVGMNRDENGKLCGDIDPEIVERSRAYTPVPGGVGPMTVAMLMENVVDYYEQDRPVYEDELVGCF